MGVPASGPEPVPGSRWREGRTQAAQCRAEANSPMPSGSTSGTRPMTFVTLDWVFTTPFGGSTLTPHASLMPFPPASVVVCDGENIRNVSDLRPERFPALRWLPGRNAAAAASCTTPQPRGSDKEPPS